MNEGISNELVGRTKQYALRVIRLFAALPQTEVARVLGKQLLRAGTSVGAHYREAQRARSTAEFISKIESALQELEESRYWLELLAEAQIFPAEKLRSLTDESGELIAIFITISKNSKTT